MMDDSSDSEDDAPVIDAAYVHDVDAVRRALAAGADINARDANGWTALHVALNRPQQHMGHRIKSGNDDGMVSMLLEAGIDVNAREAIRGRTPLHFAISSGKVDCVAVLIAAGASLTIENDEGKPPIDAVTNNNCRRIVPMLLRAGSDMPYIDQERPGSSDTTWWFHYFNPDSRWGMEPYDKENYRILSNYFFKIFMSNSGSKLFLSGPAGPGPGTFATYEKAHRAKLSAIFVPKFPQLPAEIVPTIVAFAFHTGWY